MSFVRELNCLSFARRFQALKISDWEWLFLSSIELFEVIVLTAACMESCVVNMKRLSFDSQES